jgi:flagellar M-ring protein FliF
VPPGANEPSPPTIAQAAAGTMAGMTNPVSVTQSENFDISKVTRKTTRPIGGVSRLSVAVVVDDEHYVEKDKNGTASPKTRPRTPEQIQKLHEVVTAAVGLDTTRGDQLTIHNIAFNERLPEEVPEPGLMDRYGTQVSDGLKIVAVLILGALAFFMVARPLMRRVIVDAQPVDDANLRSCPRPSRRSRVRSPPSSTRRRPSRPIAVCRSSPRG